jgi:hypothetical protein
VRSWFKAYEQQVRQPDGTVIFQYSGNRPGGDSQKVWLKFPKKEETLNIVNAFASQGFGDGILVVYFEKPSIN